MNPVKMIILLSLILQINSLTCGGNCKAGNCPECPCGVESDDWWNSTRINSTCSVLFPLQASCCKCIIASSSSGQARFMSYSEQLQTYQVGLFAMDETLVRNRC